MVTENQTYRMIPKLFGLIVLSFFLSNNSPLAQTNNDQRVELPEIAIVNILNGIQSDNHGLKMSCIYFAGKYKISEVSKDLVQEIKNSNNEELCQMLVWSLYQIGNESCCQEMRTLVKNHPSDSIRSFSKYLNNIKEYESAIVKN